MRVLGVLLGLGFLVGFVGCDSGPANVEVQTGNFDAAADLKKGLESIEKSGRIGSGYNSLTSSARTLEKTDPAKAEAVSKGLKELIELQDGAKIKAKAKEIMGKL